MLESGSVIVLRFSVKLTALPLYHFGSVITGLLSLGLC